MSAPTLSRPDPLPCGAVAPDDPDALAWIERLVRSERVRLLARARRLGLEPSEAFDCVQEAFVTFLRMPAARALADRPDECAAMLNAIVRNAARTLRRRAARRRREDPGAVESLATSDARPDDAVERAEAHGSLRRCVGELASLQRAVVTLRMLDKLPGDRVADTLGISPSHVAVVLHRAKAQLRGCMSAAGHCQCGEAAGEKEQGHGRCSCGG